MQKLVRILSAAAVCLLVLITSPVAAQQPSGSGISISPTLSQYTLKPGAANVITINLKNITVDDIIAQAAINDFKADNLTGNPQIITDPNVHSPNSIKPFIVGIQDVPLKVGEQTKVTVGLQAPKNIPPGAYYGIIRYKAVPSASSNLKNGQVALSASVGSIVLITVPGNVRSQIQLAHIHIYQGGRDSWLFFSKPDHAGIEIKNLGNGFSQPFGTIELQNMSGKQIYTYQLNNTTPRGNILPESSRIFKDKLNGVGSIGRYTLTASVASGTSSNVIILKKTFWYIPTWLALTIILVIAAIVITIFWSRRRYRVAVKRFRRKR